LDHEHINTTTLSTETRDVVRFLKIITDISRTPVFVHCHRGVERTGTMCAIYRTVVEDWSKDEAIEEMTKGGFTSRNVKKNLLNYIRNMDVDEIRPNAGLNE
jgi:protein tyrosine/serine phosphatase